MKFLALAAAAAALRLTGSVADCCEGAVCTGSLKTSVSGCATYDGCGKTSHPACGSALHAGNGEKTTANCCLNGSLKDDADAICTSGTPISC